MVGPQVMMALSVLSGLHQGLLLAKAVAVAVAAPADVWPSPHVPGESKPRRPTAAAMPWWRPRLLSTKPAHACSLAPHALLQVLPSPPARPQWRGP